VAVRGPVPGRGPGRTASRTAPAPRVEICLRGYDVGHGDQRYDGVPEGSGTSTLIRETAGQFRTGVNGRLAKTPSTALAAPPLAGPRLPHGARSRLPAGGGLVAPFPAPL